MESQLARKAQKSTTSGSQPQTQPGRPSSAEHPLLQLQQSIGNQALRRLIDSRYIQAKLQVSTPDDPFEQQADRVADTVMRMPGPPVAVREDDDEKKVAPKLDSSNNETPVIQRQKEDEEEEKELQRKVTSVQPEQQAETVGVTSGNTIYRLCNDCEEEKEKPAREMVQRKVTSGSQPEDEPSLSANVKALNGRGSPLPETARAFFEPRFGADFSQVRVHTDSQAAETADSINARAFTIGHNIAFNEGQYSPHSPAGQRLLAHELSHVIQQTDTGSLSNQLQRDDDETKPAQKRVRYPITVPKGITTDAELDRYAEVLIFGEVKNLRWTTTGGKPLNVAALSSTGKTISYNFPESLVTKHGGKDPSKAVRPSATNPTYETIKGKEKSEVNEEIDKRYSKKTGTAEGKKIKSGAQAEADIWNVYRDEVINDQKKLKSLPPKLKELMGGEKSFKPQDYERLLQIVEKLKTFSSEDIAVYQMLTLRATDNLDLFETSVDMFLARKEELKKALEQQQQQGPQAGPQSQQEAIEGSWQGFDTSKIGKVSESDQYDLARQQTWQVTKAQLEYMKNHPGETAIDFAKTATLMNTGETVKGARKDLEEALNGDANAFARWAGGMGAGAKVSGWLLAFGGVLYAVSWLTGIGELATIAGFMTYMLASTLVLSTVESELRIKAASQAKTPEEFKEQVTKGAAARTNVLLILGLLAVAFAVKIIAKTFFPETVAKISKSLARFRERVRIVRKISEVKVEFAAEMEGNRQKLVEAGESAKESARQQAEAIDKLSLDEFVDKLESGNGDFFQEAAVQKGQKVPWRALAKTPEGLKGIEAYKAQLADELRNSVPKEIDAIVKEQLDAIDKMLDQVKKATIPDEFDEATKGYDKFMGKEEVAKRGKAKEQQVRKETAEKALKELEQEIKQYELSGKAARELIGRAQAVAATVTADLAETANATGGKMEGLANAVKGEASLTRKITDRVKPREVTDKGLEEAVEISAGKMNDVLRFTMIFDPKVYVAKILAVKAALEAKGYQFVKLWNGWTKSDGTYMGVNVTFKTPTGELFELQFHTAESFKTKSQTHGLYEESRSRVATEAEKLRSDQQQQEASKGLEVPVDINKVDKIK